MAAVEANSRTKAAPPPEVALRGLYERHADRVLGFCVRRLGSRQEAEDAAQTTFLCALRGLRRGVVPLNEQAWLFAIAQNVCFTTLRASSRSLEVAHEPELVERAAGRETGWDELFGLTDALAAVPERQRRAVLLREWQGLSYREIACELGLTLPAVEALIFRARRSLAEALRGGAPRSAKEPRLRGRSRVHARVDVLALEGDQEETECRRGQSGWQVASSPGRSSLRSRSWRSTESPGVRTTSLNAATVESR
jgi:RNA polymerase sigma-70 factor (ECF subfamily)